MYYFPEPPIFLIFVGFFVGITCGLAFEATLKDKVNLWRNQPPTDKESYLSGVYSLQIPFLGICLGICVFIASGLEIFLYSRTLSYAFAIPSTILIAGLVWSQLKKLIVLLLEGGSKALDLDSEYE